MAAVSLYMAADPLGVSPSGKEGVAGLQRDALLKWGCAEEMRYRSVDAELTDKVLHPEHLRGIPLVQWCYGVRRDLQEILKEKSWDDVAMAAVVPGLAAASRVLQGKLLRLMKAIKAAPQQQLGRRGEKAANRVLSTAYAGASPVDSHAKDCNKTITSVLCIGGLSCGYSGGAAPTGNALLLHRWVDMGLTMESMGACVWIGTACRLIPGADLEELLPDWGYCPHGPRSTAYDSVCHFSAKHLPGAYEWQPDWSPSSHITWMLVAGQLAVVGFYIPCRNEELRRELLAMLFEQYDSVRKKLPLSIGIVGYGDLNPTPSLLVEYQRHLTRRNLHDLVDEATRTHVKGRRLDVAFAGAEVGVSAVVHNGQHCKQHGCTRPHCGNPAELYGCNDLDHFPVILRVTIAGGIYGATLSQDNLTWRTTFSQCPFAWSTALACHSDALGHEVSQEVHRWLTHSGTWKEAPERIMRQACSLVSWLFRASTLEAAVRGHLITVKPTGPKLSQNRGLCVRDLSRDEICAARSEGTRVAQTKQIERAEMYCHLAKTDPPSADKYLSCLLREQGVGLANVMEDPKTPGRLVSGAELLQCAAEYVESRGSDRTVRLSRDEEQYRRIQVWCDNLLRDARDKWRQECGCQTKLYTLVDLQAVLGKLPVDKKCQQFPYAAAKCCPPGCQLLLLAVQNISKFLCVVSERWKRQPMYHSHKPGRSRTTFSGYRTLALNGLELRISEELWAATNEALVWEATGQAQLGRYDCMFATMLNIESTLIRVELALPVGTIYTDNTEAFDTVWPVQVTVQLSAAVGLPPEEVLLANDMLQGTAVQIVSKGKASDAVQPTAGVPEGRRLAPVKFVAVAALFRTLPGAEHIQLGLDPPLGAICAYHRTKDGSDRHLPELPLCQKLLEAGPRTDNDWLRTMAQAGNDSNRLLLLDLSSATQVGLVQFLDDNMAKVSSWGAGVLRLRQLSKAAEAMKAELKLGAGKTEFQSVGFHENRSMPSGAGSVQKALIHKGLGLPLEDDLSFRALLKQVESRAVGTWQATLVAIEVLGLPAWVAIASLDARVLPKACFGAELLILTPGWQMRLDSLMDRLIKMLLRLPGSYPRLFLLQAIGRGRRLSTQVLYKCFALEARLDSLPERSLLSQVRSVAQQHSGTWAAVLAAQRASRQLPDITSWASGQSCRDMSKNQVKRRIRRFMAEVIDPALIAEDAAWAQQSETRYGSPHVLEWANHTLQDIRLGAELIMAPTEPSERP
jgi:hypothetical protein